MVNFKVAEAGSAHPDNQQYATLSQQVKTRMLNCDLSTNKGVRVDILNEFVKMLITSKFKRIMFAKIVRNGVLAYLKDLAKHRLRIKSIHTSAAQGMYVRRINKSKGGGYRGRYRY